MPLRAPKTQRCPSDVDVDSGILVRLMNYEQSGTLIVGIVRTMMTTVESRDLPIFQILCSVGLFVAFVAPRCFPPRLAFSVNLLLAFALHLADVYAFGAQQS